ncbi:hypothetical protein EVA_05166 [gut metagenome]|uniref:Uncharacterized protein n=1 Tax=gut metagenome TaxID=749906 RepID=J9GHZ4_9ZZZZ
MKDKATKLLIARRKDPYSRTELLNTPTQQDCLCHDTLIRKTGKVAARTDTLS